ncbi:MAG: hypothetical protein NC417_08975 [Candidatus Gastranaerophilales bacterium]|nr:hypothetical protein [Candidatus Gastranaerophilales bacterium]
MSLLNKEAYAMGKDKLVYDAKHPIDGAAVRVAISADGSGEIKRGQVLDCADGVYRVHAEGGTVSVIAAEDTSYSPSDDTEITVAVYTSGTFRASEVIADPELTAGDVEVFRAKGIYLK